ncbi:FtsX-like permease family protein [Planococcus halotolerans]|uniref:ABC transporter permease n=1 Tax=Planococcus halotolerans TaxID=2233542 RepID=A0A365KXP2_9BACL|nr:ABC transporter permease [Planococcus halotolerans]QHJ72105.1 FtsX-like permease family protein [Planococcus halotolerans]RAZ77879.1 ABC transporter permease [Planococcus halotolerans]
MNNRFFSSLALRNIKSNKQLYIPFLLSSTAIIAMFFLMVSLMTNRFVQERSSSLPTLFMIGVVVIGIFSVIFILYTNSFLIKRRKKEIGLYGILGLEKKHVAKILFFESLFSSLLSIAAGLLTGLLFGRLVFMLLNFMLRMPNNIMYTTSLLSVGVTIALFTVIFGLTYLYNVSQFTFANPIKLLKGKQEGEKEPKGSLILFILSLIFLGWGYGISITIPDPLAAIEKFFLAVLLVIIGTYLLFISGSIFILKALKNNKRIYYRPGAFISISGMLYRMKQNAVGLANICILASMVIIAVSTTVTIYLGSEETLENRYPYEHNIKLFGDMDNVAEMNNRFFELQDEVLALTEEKGLEVTEMESYRYESFFGKLEDGSFVFEQSSADGTLPILMMAIPLEDFNEMAGENYSLEDDEALFYHSTKTYEKEELAIGNKSYRLTEIENEFSADMALTESIAIVVPDVSHLLDFREAYMEQFPESTHITIDAEIGWNTEGTEEQEEALIEQLRSEYSFSSENDGLYNSRDVQREEWYSVNGGFLFLGVFLGLLFTLGTLLITYFKQVSEGFDDRGKFQIMQKVGLDEEMIKESTRSQIVWMFLLPIVIATIHVSFAYPIVRKLLMIFGVTNDMTWLLTFIAVVIAFAAIYWMIYRVTSRVYYSIVK